MKEKLRELGQTLYAAMMTGVGYMVPVIVCGGIIMAIPNLWTNGNAAQATEGLAYIMYNWGKGLFGLMYYVLGMFTAYGIAGRPGIPAGLVAGWFAVNGAGGFADALIGGMVGGFVVKALIKYLKVPEMINAAKTLIFVPLLSCLSMFFFMHFVIDPIMTLFVNLLTEFVLLCDATGNRVLLMGIHNAIVSIAMGGPLGYACLPLLLRAVETGDLTFNASCLIGSTAGNLGLAISILLFKNKFDEEDRNGLVSCIVGWLFNVAEFQIPYYIKNIGFYTIAFIISGFVGGAVIGATGATAPASHGGIFTGILVADKVAYFGAMFAQAFTLVLLIALFKKGKNKNAVSMEENV